MERGQKVVATQYGGQKVVRRVVADLGSTIIICNDLEYFKALEQNREPQGIGFPREAIELAEDNHANS